MPLTFVLQCINALLVGTAAVLCLRVRAPQNAHHHFAWWITGVTFLWHALSDAAQNVYGAMAIHGGEHSATWAAYMRADPVMNHGRTFLVYGLLLVLTFMAAYRRELDGRFRLGSLAVLCVGLAVGSAVGWYEGPFATDRHYSAVAAWDVVELVALMIALFALLVSNRADRLLWGFLTIYGIALALSAFWFSVFAKFDLGGWEPPTWTMPAERILFDCLMLGFVVRRLMMQRRGRSPEGMLGRPIARLSTLH